MDRQIQNYPILIFDLYVHYYAVYNSSRILSIPAKPKKDVREIVDRETGESHYPWPYRFSRNMPWSEDGYDKWVENNLCEW